MVTTTKSHNVWLLVLVRARVCVVRRYSCDATLMTNVDRLW